MEETIRLSPNRRKAMPSESGRETQTAKQKQVNWLVDRTGITNTQAYELIDLLGVGNLPSLVREALLLKK
ncbi:hypothetical protein LB553_24315 [Mesorhizobium sp. CA8]|nr:hypothetical protein [Mesorhizobium sp. CA8]